MELFFLTPAVSIRMMFLFLDLIGISIESLVVPDFSETRTLSSPMSLFVKVDLPTFGLPIIEILKSFLLS